jgi:hypothetical protein
MSRVSVLLWSLVAAGLLPLTAAAQVVAPDGWVVLPIDEYRTLRERTRPPSPAPLTPVDATLTRVDYELRLDGDAITGRALLTIDVLRDGWARVQIPQGLMAREARLEGQPVSLVEGPPPHVLLARAGRQVLTLDIAVPLTSAAGSESIALPASAAPISRATLVLPRSGVDLVANGGFIADRGEGPAESRWTAYGRPNQRLTLSWKRKVDDRRASLPLRLRATVTQLVTLGEDAGQVSASVRMDVQQGVARELDIALPAGMVVNQVNGPTVGDWEVSGTSLRVRFLEAVASDAAFVVQGDVPSSRDGAVAIPLVRVPGAERENGGVAVDVAGAGEITGRQLRGLEPADASELGDVVAGRESPSMIAFRLRPMSGTDNRTLTVDVVRYTPQAVLIANIEEARYRTVVAEDGQLLVEGRYAVRNNQRSFLKVTMPEGATLWSAAVAGRPTRPGVAEAGAVLIPLEKGRAGEEAPTFVVSLVYLQAAPAWPDKGRARIDLPALDLPVSRTGVRMYHSPRFAVSLESGVFRIEHDPGPFAEALRAPAPAPTASPAASSTRLPAARSVPSLLNLTPGTASSLESLIDQYRVSAGPRTVVGALPVTVAFPDVGPSLFMAAELTSESTSPVVQLSLRRSRQ